jgi:PAS domain S-box-containing protein
MRPLKANILLVDDHPENLTALEAILSGLDQNLVRAYSGREALRLLLKDDYALILMDAEMPGMDGYETAQLIRMRPRSRHTPIIFLTAINKDANQVFRGYSVGAVDYIFKPLVPEILKYKVLVFVDQYLKTSEIARQAEQMARMNRELEAANARMSQLFRDVQNKNVELQMERDFVTTVLHTAGSLVLILDREGCILRFNRFCEQLTGYTFDDVKGRKVWELLLPPRQVDAAIAHFERVRQSSCMIECENTWVTKDGTQRLIAWCHTPLPGNGPHAEYIIATGMEITERRKAEEVRAQVIREQAARIEAETAQRRFAFLAEASASLFSTLDPQNILRIAARLAVPGISDWCIVYSKSESGALEPVQVAHEDRNKDEAARALLNYSPDSSQEHHPLLKVHRTAQADLIPELQPERLEAFASNENHLAILRYLGLTAAIVVPLVARGRVLGVIQFSSSSPARRFGCPELSLAEDFGHRVAMAIENARLYHKAQEASNAKDQFLATISHELRTPLNAMLGWARLLRSGKLDAASSARAIETIERNARAQAQLIEDILDISRIVTGKLRLSFQNVELAPIIESALDAARPTAEIKGIRLESELDGACDIISGDPNRLQQIAWNLISNAVKFTPAGGRVMVRLQRSDSLVQLSVQDNGQGISPEFLPHVFERFSQAEGSSTRSHTGLGLGLSIVRHLVELHGGNVRAESAGAGSGATFTVTFPAPAARAQVAQSEIPAAATPRIAEGSLLGLRVLAVDGETEVREQVTSFLNRYGAQVSSAATGADALALSRLAPPHVVIVNVQLPDEDGCALLARMRQSDIGSLADVPAIAITPGPDDGEARRLSNSGFQMWLAKPLEAEKLAESIATVTGRASVAVQCEQKEMVAGGSAPSATEVADQGIVPNR